MHVTQRNLWTLIPAAGRSERFREMGYHTPKPLLTVRDRSGDVRLMMDHCLYGLPQYNVVIGLPQTIQRTTGQADTIRQMCQHLPRGDKAIVCDVDTMLHRDVAARVVRSLDITGAAVVAAVTRNEGDVAMSRIDKFPTWNRCAEKEPISEWGVVGLRAFQNIGDLYDTLTWACLMYEEPYLSHAMNKMHGPKYAVEVQRDEYQDWGTPEKLTACGAEIV